MENTCVSINVGPPISDKVLCQLSNSDSTQHPDDLKPVDGFMYRGSEVKYFNSIIFTLMAILFCFSCVLYDTVHSQ